MRSLAAWHIAAAVNPFCCNGAAIDDVGILYAA